MEERVKLAVDQATLTSILAMLSGMPNPDDPGDPNNPWGPWGPGGPVLGPLPDPWRFGAQMLVAMAAVFETMRVRPELHDAGRQVIGAQVQMYLDDWWCGNEPRWPFPWPKPRGFDLTLRPVDVAVVGTMLRQTAKLLAQDDLGAEVDKVGSVLLERGLNNQRG